MMYKNKNKFLVNKMIEQIFRNIKKFEHNADKKTNLDR